jgi:hypothetical protein
MSEELLLEPVLYNTSMHHDFRKFSRYGYQPAKPPKDHLSASSAKACLLAHCTVELIPLRPSTPRCRRNRSSALLVHSVSLGFSFVLFLLCFLQ